MSCSGFAPQHGTSLLASCGALHTPRIPGTPWVKSKGTMSEVHLRTSMLPKKHSKLWPLNLWMNDLTMQNWGSPPSTQAVTVDKGKGFSAPCPRSNHFCVIFGKFFSPVFSSEQSQSGPEACLQPQKIRGSSWIFSHRHYQHPPSWKWTAKAQSCLSSYILVVHRLGRHPNFLSSWKWPHSCSTLTCSNSNCTRFGSEEMRKLAFSDCDMLVTQISEVLFVGRDQARKTDRWANGHENCQWNIAYWYLSDLDLDILEYVYERMYSHSSLGPRLGSLIFA